MAMNLEADPSRRGAGRHSPVTARASLGQMVNIPPLDDDYAQKADREIPERPRRVRGAAASRYGATPPTLRPSLAPSIEDR